MSVKFRQIVYLTLVVGSVVYYSDVLNLIFKYVSSGGSFLDRVSLTLSVNVALIMGSLVFVKIFDFLLKSEKFEGNLSSGLFTFASQILVFFIVNMGILILHKEVSGLGLWQSLFERHLIANIQVGHLMLATILITGGVFLALVTSIENRVYHSALSK